MRPVAVVGSLSLDRVEGGPPRIGGGPYHCGRALRILGGPARLAISSGEGRVRIEGQGTSNLGQLRAEYPQHPLLTRLSGSTDWQVAINVQKDLAAWTLESTLKGAAIDLPVPGAKAAADAVPLKLERRVADKDRTDVFVLSAADTARLTRDRSAYVMKK